MLQFVTVAVAFQVLSAGMGGGSSCMLDLNNENDNSDDSTTPFSRAA